MLSTASLPIAADDTTGTLTGRLAALGADLLIGTLPAYLRSDIQPQPQGKPTTYAPHQQREDGQIDWTEPAGLIAWRVRAYQPWPSAYTTWNGLMLKVLRGRAAGEGPSDAMAGTVIGGPRDCRRGHGQECCGWKRCSWPGSALCRSMHS